MVEMELIGVQVELPFNSPMMLLREAEGHRVLPIVIDVPEAQAIGRGVDGVRTSRPMTHDLMAQMLDALDTRLLRVVVTELRDHTFFAELVLDTLGVERRLSARPSDAVALAVRGGAPIFASDEVLDVAGQPLIDDSTNPDDILAGGLSADDRADTADEDADPDVLLDEFKQFLDDINPEDFES